MKSLSRHFSGKVVHTHSITAVFAVTLYFISEANGVSDVAPPTLRQKVHLQINIISLSLHACGLERTVYSECGMRTASNGAARYRTGTGVAYGGSERIFSAITK